MKGTSQQRFSVFFTKLFLTKKPSFKLLKNNKFKNTIKKIIIELQVMCLVTKKARATQLIDENGFEEDRCSFGLLRLQSSCT